MLFREILSDFAGARCTPLRYVDCRLICTKSTLARAIRESPLRVVLICHSERSEESHAAGSAFDARRDGRPRPSTIFAQHTFDSQIVGEQPLCCSVKFYQTLRARDARPYGVLRCRWLCVKSDLTRGAESSPPTVGGLLFILCEIQLCSGGRGSPPLRGMCTTVGLYESCGRFVNRPYGLTFPFMHFHFTTRTVASTVWVCVPPPMKSPRLMPQSAKSRPWLKVR